MKKLKVLMVPTSNSGVSYYRLWTWAVAAHRTGTMRVNCLWWKKDQNETHPWEIDIDDPQYRSRILNELNACARDADIVIFQMCHTYSALNAFLSIKEAYPNTPVLAEIDDNMLSTADYNPASVCYGPGDKFREIAVEQFRAADAMIVSTPYLEQVYGDLNENIHTVPNCLDFKLWGAIRKKKRAGIRIGWAGGASHDQDLKIIEPVVHNILKKYRDVQFVFVHGAPSFLKGIPRVHCLSKFTRIDRYPGYLASLGLDIGLAPLVDNAFNRGKTMLRWLEYAGLGIPCVASNVGNFKETIKDGVDGLLCSTASDFEAKLSWLIENRAERRAMGARANARARKDFNVDNGVSRYAGILSGIIKQGQINPIIQSEYAQPINQTEAGISAPGVVS